MIHAGREAELHIGIERYAARIACFSYSDGIYRAEITIDPTIVLDGPRLDFGDGRSTSAQLRAEQQRGDDLHRRLAIAEGRRHDAEARLKLIKKDLRTILGDPQ